MAVLSLLLREIRHRAGAFTMGVLAVAVGAGLCVALLTTSRAANREAGRLMRNLGFNVLVVPEGTDVATYWATDQSDRDMPEDAVRRLADSPEISADHFVATLKRWVTWRGKQALLTGILPEYPKKGATDKAPMGYRIEPGTCIIGYALAMALDVQRGDTIDVLGKALTVERRLLEAGGKDDVRIYVDLHDAQEMLGLPGRINEIEALGCVCYGDTFDTLREQIERVLPGVHATELRDLATARAETRHMVERHAILIEALGLVACVAWVAVLAWLNVRERRREIGILRALGFRGVHIAALFFGRSALMGIAGGALGFALGTIVALHCGAGIFRLTLSNVRPAYDLLAPTLIATPLVSLVAGLVPGVLALVQDPASVLAEE